MPFCGKMRSSCARVCYMYCIVYTVYCMISPCIRFYFMGHLRVSASYLLMSLSFLNYVTFVLFYSLSSYRFLCSRVGAFFCISFTADGPQRARLPSPSTATFLSCLWSLSIFQSLPGSRLTNFYRDAGSSAFFLQLVNQ